jgi:hypothetical protein
VHDGEISIIDKAAAGLEKSWAEKLSPSEVAFLLKYFEVTPSSFVKDTSLWDLTECARVFHHLSGSHSHLLFATANLFS